MVTTALAKRTRKKNEKRGFVATPPLGSLPGVPAFHEGGVVGHTHDIPWSIAAPANPPGSLAESLAQVGWRELPEAPGWWFDPAGGGQPVYLGPPIPDPAPGPASPQWRPGELGLQQAAQAIREAELELDRAIRTGDLALRTRAQEALERATEAERVLREREAGLAAEVQQRGQDVQAATAMLDRIQREAASLRADAIARHDAQLAARAQRLEEASLTLQQQIAQADQALTQRGQDIAAARDMNLLLLDAWQLGNQSAIDLGNLQLGREAEQRLRAQMQQQVVLDQHSAALEAAGLSIQAQTAAGGQAGQLAMGLGQIEARRAENLGELAANPRDFMQLQFALGGGQNILNQLAQGQPFEGQSVGRAGNIPTLGGGHQQLVNEVTQRRDLPFFEWARGLTNDLAGMAQNVPQAPGLGMLQGLGRLPGMAPAPTMQGAPNFASLNFPGVAAIPGIEELLKALGLPPQLPPPTPSPDLGFTPPPHAQFKHGGELVIREPVVGIGQLSGRPLFTLVEDGKPETLRPTPTGMEVIPFQEGGNVQAPLTLQPGQPGFDVWQARRRAVGAGSLAASPAPPAANQPAQGAFGNIDEIYRRAGLLPPDMITGEPISTVPRPPPQMPGGEAPGLRVPAPAPPAQPTGGPSLVVPLPPGVVLPPDAVTGQPGQALIPALPPNLGVVGEHQISPGVADVLINNPNAAAQALAQAEAMGATGPQVDWLRNLVQVQADNNAMALSQGLQGYEGYRPAGMQTVAPQAPAAAPQAPAGPSAEEANRLIRNFMSTMTPQAYNSMTPSQIEVISSIVSALGFPPEDFWASVFAGWPQGADPSRVLAGTF